MRILREVEVFRDCVAFASERTRAGTELTRTMLARSRELLELSRALLRAEPPTTWPKPSRGRSHIELVVPSPNHAGAVGNAPVVMDEGLSGTPREAA